MTFGVALYCILVGVSGLREELRRNRASILGVAIVLIAAAGANRAWEATYGTDVAQEGPLAYPWRDKIGEAFSRLPRLGAEWIGKFGWLDTSLPKAAVLAWLGVGAAMVALALVLGRARQRLALLVALALAVAVAVILSATLRAGELGGNVQARHLMPFLVVIPLLAGEMVTQRATRWRNVGIALAILVCFTTTVQFVAWYLNARRQSVGVDGSLFFLADPDWEPPLGWPFWLVVTIGALGLLLASAVIDARDRRSGPRLD